MCAGQLAQIMKMTLFTNNRLGGQEEKLICTQKVTNTPRDLLTLESLK